MNGSSVNDRDWRKRAEAAEAELARVADAMYGPTMQTPSERVAAYVAKVEALNLVVGYLTMWTRRYGDALVPPGPDTYGEGMRDAKDQVRRILQDGAA